MPQSSTRRSATVLVVDDDEGVTKTFARMLRLEGYKVHTAVSAEQGLTEAQLCHPDAILLDLRMPQVDGVEFLRRLRALDGLRGTPVGVVTGDYSLDNAILTDLRELGAELRFKPMWIARSRQLGPSSAPTFRKLGTPAQFLVRRRGRDDRSKARSHGCVRGGRRVGNRNDPAAWPFGEALQVGQGRHKHRVPVVDRLGPSFGEQQAPDLRPDVVDQVHLKVVERNAIDHAARVARSLQKSA